MGTHKDRVTKAHLGAGVVAAGLCAAAGPLSLAALPFIALWWRKAAKDAVKADLQDEMEDTNVEERLASANESDLDYLTGSGLGGSVSRSETWSRRHPVFGVRAEHTIRHDSES